MPRLFPEARHRESFTATTRCRPWDQSQDAAALLRLKGSIDRSRDAAGTSALTIHIPNSAERFAVATQTRPNAGILEHLIEPG